MKNLKILSIIVVATIAVAAVSCNKKDQIKADLAKDIVGTYTGTLTGTNKAVSDATADITETDENLIEIRCYGGDFDTTFTQRIFEDGEMLRMCSTGEDFYNEYGHNMTDQNEHHDMMNDADGMSWSHHMSEEHEAGDEHFGFYDMNTDTFTYTFKMKSGNTPYDIEFSGKRK